MVQRKTSKPRWRLAHCATALALSLALPAFADDEQREDKTEPFQIEFDNPCTPDHLSGQGQIRRETKTINKGNGTTEIRERSRVMGNPLGTPSLAIYNFQEDNNSVTRTSATTFRMTVRHRVKGIPDRKTGSTGLPVAAFFVTEITEVSFGPTTSSSRFDPDTKCKDRQGRDIDAG